LLFSSLSARLLVLTVFFVMVSEVLIFVPSVARYRMDTLENRIAAGYLASLSLRASKSGHLPQSLTNRLLAEVGAHAVEVRRASGMVEMLDSLNPPKPALRVNLLHWTALSAIAGSWGTLTSKGNRVLSVVGRAPGEKGARVSLLLDEAPLRSRMWGFGRRILEMSAVISLLTASLVYGSLQVLLVRPMRRLRESMTRFREDPEDASRRIAPEKRRDEIGEASRELAMLQETVRQALGQRARLAALGTAVSKIQHDLRNILATARLLTDALATSAAPEMRRLAPRLIDAIDRAVALSTGSLDFSREGAPPFAPSRFLLAPLVAELEGGLLSAARLRSAIPPDFEIWADRALLYRVLLNLAKNAVEAGAREIAFSLLGEGETLAIEVADDGPGMPPRARENLFRPFFGSARPGGAGLGLAIARELMRVQGGDLLLLSTTAEGTAFRLTLPAQAERPAALARRAKRGT
jgi:signal transduction histidine kinase